MRKLLLAGCSSLALMLAGSASAADMGIPLKAPPPVAPAYSWTGCYLGVHAGGGAMNNSETEDEWGGGGLAGGQIGCNYQTEHLVVGIEGEGWWSGLRSTLDQNQGDPIAIIFPTLNDTVKNRWDFDVAARAGFAWDRALIYGKAGVAWGRFNVNEVEVLAPDTITTVGNVTLPGLLLGVGGEYAFSPNWSAKLEYNFIDYFAETVAFTQTDPASIPPTSVLNRSFSATKQIVKIGLNYKVGP